MAESKINEEFPWEARQTEAVKSYEKFRWWMDSGAVSYQKVANHFKCSLTNIQAMATKHHWRERRRKTLAYFEKKLLDARAIKVVETHEAYDELTVEIREFLNEILTFLKNKKTEIMNRKQIDLMQLSMVMKSVTETLEKAQKMQLTALGEAYEITKTEHSGSVSTIEITRNMPERPEKPKYEEES